MFSWLNIVIAGPDPHGHRPERTPRSESGTRSGPPPTPLWNCQALSIRLEVGRRGGGGSGEPVPADHLGGGPAIGPLEVRPERIGDREETDLGEALLRDAQERGELLLPPQVTGRPRAAESPRPQREHEAPDGLDDGPPEAGLIEDVRSLRPAREEREQQRRAAMEMLTQVAGRLLDPIGSGHARADVSRVAEGGDEVVEARVVDLRRARDQIGIIDHDPSPAVQVSAVRCLEGDLQALFDQGAGNGPIEVQPLSNRARRRQQVVCVEIQHVEPSSPWRLTGTPAAMAGARVRQPRTGTPTDLGSFPRRSHPDSASLARAPAADPSGYADGVRTVPCSTRPLRCID